MATYIERLIEEKRVDLKETVDDERQLGRVLNRSVELETKSRIKRERELPRAEFNGQELKQLEENAITLRDPKTLRLAQTEMESHFGQTQAGREKLVARAIGRAEATNISLQDVDERIKDFSESREFVSVIFEGADGRERTASLHDLQPKSFTDKLFSFFSAKDRLEINAVNQALDERYADLLSERNSIEQFTAAARAIAKDWTQRLQSPSQTIDIQPHQALQPQFTEREIAQLVNFAAKQIDPTVRAQFENVIQSSLTAGRVGDFTQFSAAATQAQSSNATGFRVSDPAQLHNDDYLDAARNALDKVAAKPDPQLGTLKEAAAAIETDAELEVLAAFL